MTDAEKREALARIFGWGLHHGGLYVSIPNAPKGRGLGALVDPLSDHNVVRYAIELLPVGKRGFYADTFAFLFGSSQWDALTARPRDLAAALLVVHGLDP